jgi:EAL domain-containing protein (putative c-di-GMP-specific phosphodiesterase class I)
MYQSKRNNKNQYSFFTLQLNQDTARRFTLENSLRMALTNNELYVLYQPQINIKKKQIYGFEALIRWQHPKLGLISPIEFIPIAESIGLINEIGEFVLQESIKHIKKWNKNFISMLSISVNISSRQFENSSLPDFINSLLEEYNCPTKYLKIEITESLLLQDSSHTLDQLKTLSNSGVLIALDDFGTGYSSLSYLKKFPINMVKIDQSFIRDLSKQTEDTTLVKTIISMANGLGMTTIAEGVETEEQLIFLETEGCYLIQGYYYSKPIDAKDIDTFLSNWH